MKCAIFCLLALCAFEIVFADQLQQDLKNLYKKYLDQKNKIVNPLHPAIKAEIDHADKNGIKTGGKMGCLGSSEIAIFTYVEPKSIQLDNCRDKAAQKKDIKFAQKCYSDIIKALEEGVKKVHELNTACIKGAPQPKPTAVKKIKHP